MTDITTNANNNEWVLKNGQHSNDRAAWHVYVLNVLPALAGGLTRDYIDVQ